MAFLGSNRAKKKKAKIVFHRDLGFGDCLEAKLQRIQDGVQIFLATFLWMSLFFWASAWDGRNNNKPNKRSKF
ncbi:hypothetical protein AMTRI_Chr05g74350 [Amborella trichopoda]